MKDGNYDKLVEQNTSETHAETREIEKQFVIHKCSRLDTWLHLQFHNPNRYSQWCVLREVVM